MNNLFKRDEKKVLREMVKQKHGHPKETKKKTLDKIKEGIFKWAGNPSDEQIEGIKIYGVRAMSLSKKDLIIFTIYQEKRYIESQERAIKDLEFMSEIQEAIDR